MFLHIHNIFLFNRSRTSLGKTPLAIFLASIFFGWAHPGKAETQRDPFGAFPQTDTPRTLSPVLQRKLPSLGEENAADEELPLLFSLKHPLAESERDQLKKEGFRSGM
jgi:hypothetical protein